MIKLSPRVFVPVSVVIALVAGCGKGVPAAVKPTLDSIRADARKVADAAAATCGDQWRSGRFTATGGVCATNLLPGEKLVANIPSPAKGTSLEGNAMIEDLQTT